MIEFKENEWIPFKPMANTLKFSKNYFELRCDCCNNFFKGNIVQPVCSYFSNCNESVYEELKSNITFGSSYCKVCFSKKLKLWKTNKHVIIIVETKPTISFRNQIENFNLSKEAVNCLDKLYDKYKYYRCLKDLDEIYKTILKLHRNRMKRAVDVISMAYLKHLYSTEQCVSRLGDHFYSVGKVYLEK